MLKVSKQSSGQPETFRSLQGEGPTMGTPTVFLRLALCNLACTWCDTKYTWDWRNFDYTQEVMPETVQDVEERILSLGCPHLVVTGGEPLLQQRELAPLVASLKERDFFCEVETNGTIEPSREMTGLIDQWNVSPKLANSGNDPSRMERPGVLKAFAQLPNAYFKFVVAEPPDVDEVCRLQERYALPGHRILLMPEGTSPKAIQARSPWLAEACARQGYRFSTRLHILLWGDVRGR